MNSPTTERSTPALWFGMVCGLLLGARTAFSALNVGLDPSFVYAYNAAAVAGAEWGREFILTYGPLGYLINPLDMGSHVWQWVAFNTLAAVAVGAAAALVVDHFPELGRRTRLLLIFAIVYASGIQLFEWPFFSLLMLVLLLAHLERRQRVGMLYLGLAGALAGVFFLIKFSLGFGSLATIVLTAPLFAAPARAAARTAIAVGCALLGSVGGWLLTGGPLSGLGDYVATGWEMSSGYSATMAIQPVRGWVSAVCFVAFFILYAVWVLQLRDRRALRLGLVAAFPAFMAWKHAMVRQDGHVAFLTLFGLLLLALLLPVSLARGRTQLSIAAGAACVVLLSTASFAPQGLVAPGQMTSMLVEPARRVIRGELLRLARFDAYRQRQAETSLANLEPYLLHPSMKEIVGDATVDVYPWLVAYAPANGLNWHNRPVPASFSAYTPALDEMNESFFRSDRRPEFLLWHHDVGVRGIDGRYLLHDEPRTARAILDLYDIRAAAGEVSLLQKRTEPRFAPVVELTRQQAAWEEWVDTPEVESGVLLLSVSMRLSPLARAKRFLYRQDPIFIGVRFVGGEEIHFRVTPENLNSGMWIAPFPANAGEFRELLGEGMSRAVTAVRLLGDGVTRSGGELEMTWSRVDVRGAPTARPPSPPAGLAAATASEERCAGAVEHGWVTLRDWDSASRFLALRGWARDGERSVDSDSLWLTDGDGRALPTRARIGLARPDVARHYDSEQLGDAGWLALTPLPATVDRIGFVVRSRSGELVRSCNQWDPQQAAPRPDG